MRNPILFLLFIIALLTQVLTTNAQINSYNDVAVIVNTNSTTSVHIADYFINKRGIPAENRINIQVPEKEEISQQEFDSLLTQIQAALNTQHFALELNYLVTTKGMPLKIRRYDNDSLGCNASVESELMLLHPANSSKIGNCASLKQLSQGSYFRNPYFQRDTNFLSSRNGIYLVTRLDAYTEEQVKSLIDRSGPLTYVNKDSVLFVLDQAINFRFDPLNMAFATADEQLRIRGWHTLLNTDSVFVTEAQNVLGYVSWGSNDAHANRYTQHAQPNFSWAEGSIAETHVSTSARSFMPGTAYGQSLIADLIAEGACGAKGYVYEPFTIAIALSNILFDSYTNLDANGFPKYNLAESYFMASRMISWMDVVIGDPKTSITTNKDETGINKIQEAAFLSIYPNPASTNVCISVSNQKDAGLFSITDLSGRILKQTNEPCMDISGLQNGIYLIRYLKQTAKLVVNSQ